MKIRNFDHLQCPVAAALSVIGDHWSLLVIRDLFFGLTRFDDFQANLGIARNMLSERLRKLIEEGVVAKVPGKHGRAEYRLTEDGLALRRVLVEMAKWGEAHRPEKSGDSKW